MTKQIAKKGKEMEIQTKQMIKDGFPLCYRDKEIDYHCQTCIKRWKNLKEVNYKIK